MAAKRLKNMASYRIPGIRGGWLFSSHDCLDLVGSPTFESAVDRFKERETRLATRDTVP